MPDITIQIKNKIASLSEPVEYICGNSDYTVTFLFDDQWNGIPVKTARFQVGTTYVDKVFTENVCTVPVFTKGKNGSQVMEVGVFAGVDEAMAQIRSTTTAMIPMKPGVLSKNGSPDAPKESVYDQIMVMLNRVIAACKVPYIGENNHWWVADTDTGVSAVGPAGQMGSVGPRGESGLVPLVSLPYQVEITLAANAMTSIAPLTGPIAITLGEPVAGYDNEWSFTLTQGETAQTVVLPEVMWGLGFAPVFTANSTLLCRLYYMGTTLCGEWVIH